MDNTETMDTQKKLAESALERSDHYAAPASQVIVLRAMVHAVLCLAATIARGQRYPFNKGA